MHKIRIYVDTSVFGGVFDEEFCQPSRNFFDAVVQGRYIVLISAITLDEIQGAPDRVRQLMDDLPSGSIEEIALGQEIRKLAEEYLAAGALGPNLENDALHVAAASVAKADAIVSWNFKHIVNFDRIRKFNGVNVMNGYPPIAIHSPLEFADADENQDI
jgi:predicted nucleic acid-binding protein